MSDVKFRTTKTAFGELHVIDQPEFDELFNSNTKIMEKEKYFTPEIWDIHVDYECECINIDNGQWFKYNIRTDENLLNFMDEMSLLDNIAEGHIRVAYLTKEQIENEGWKHYGNNCFELNPRWFCSWYPEQKRMEIYDEENENNFAGECKDINAFRKICKLLGI